MISPTWFLSQIVSRNSFQYPQLNAFKKDSLPLSSIQSPPSPSLTSSTTRISPAVLFIIVILAVIFFVSGLLHLLVRFLIKKGPSASRRSNRSTNTAITGDSDALQRQLQQLFHLHDSGLDQAFIDALPVFLYKEIVGAKEPFDCAVCLCEFSDDDKLRLLPICGHAFHLNCIDTWLLSNSTCPLCRGALFIQGLAIENPMFDFDDLREDEENPDENHGEKPAESEEIVTEKRVFPVRLGKFRSVSNGVGGGDGNCGARVVDEGDDGSVRREEGETSSSNLDARRCFSMGSYQYVVQDANLQVALSSGVRIGEGKSLRAPVGLIGNSAAEDGVSEGKKLHAGSKGESFSVSKIWLWSNKKGKLPISDASNPDGSLPWMISSGGFREVY
ncbi:RING-H2 finger protein ATL46-like isoform X2 [Phalaenopsis equestris]|uniref:RING-H2 finger protein ATL46-like isoform X2 n=1 Tax=Phalaenopsis equestris TaxID=78828 RepID=UPI0009E59C21|nr:RING-H2 finger protein ATL46-like isoform X2 [Phalaenopsis equestris]